jgi:nucleotide-binding universal stress UspA family protein
MKIQDLKNPIVVPWDYSDLSRDALLRAVEMVSDTSLIRVVHVSHIPSPYEYGVVFDDISEQTMSEELTKSFHKAVESEPKLAGQELVVLFGDPGHEICDYAGKEKAELIVLPSHGRSGFSRLLLGSTAERVVRFAPCPVLVLRSETAE